MKSLLSKAWEKVSKTLNLKFMNRLNNNNNHFKYSLFFLVLYFVLGFIVTPQTVSFDFFLNEARQVKNGTTFATLYLESYNSSSKNFYAKIHDGKTYYIKIYTQDYQDYRNKLLEISKLDISTITKELNFVEKIMFRNYVDLLFYLSILLGAIGLRSKIKNIAMTEDAVPIEKEKVKVRFSDVQGIDNIKSEVTEVVKYFTNSSKIKAMGGKPVSGIILHGGPGTGKTLLAKAIAGETNASFIATSGSQFVEMYVGLGAKRIRDLFKQARESRPCVIFIDEIDAFGVKRGSNRSHSELDQTVNELLTQMDGMKDNEGILVVAATNRLELLDDALIREGRFDRKIKVDLPSLEGRKNILNLYLNKIPKKNPDVDVESLAKTTTYFSGAKLKSLVDEAIYESVKRESDEVSMNDFIKAKDKIVMGVERDLKLTDEDKKYTAYHEIGHALVSFIFKIGEVAQVSIVPRGMALGVTQMTDTEQVSFDIKNLKHRVMMLLGGKAAEKVFFNHQSTGVSNDLKRATDITRQMICEFGMGSIGPINVAYGSQEYSSLSEQMKYNIDKEVIDLLKSLEKATEELLVKHKDLVEFLSQKLIEKEVINMVEFSQICNEFLNKNKVSNG